MKYIIAFLFLMCGVASLAQVESKISIPISAYPNSRPALLQLPDDYASTATKYALLVFGHGAGQRSNTVANDPTYQAGGYLSSIYTNAGSGGPAYFIEQGSWPSSFTNPVDGLQYKFIVLSPQNDSWSVHTSGVKDIITWMVANYRVDTNRIYTTGLSAGGEETAMGYESEYDIEDAVSIAPVRYKPAAVILMSPQLPTPTVNPTWIATSVTDSVPNWGFGSPSNDQYGQRAKDFIDGQNAIKANYSRFTTYASGHCCWNTFYNPSYTEVIGGQTMNLYQWLLTKKRNASIPNTTGIFTFTLSSAQRTSAAVYKSDSTLVRTLWADSTFAAGTYTRYWNGKDDYGVTISSPDANYYIRVLTNNVTYNWDGIIGNTSSSNTGAGVHRGYYTSMTGMAITGTTAYFTQGYSEAISSQAKFSTLSPQVRVSLTGFGGRVITMNADYVVTDGTAVYWAGYDGFNSAQNFVMATSVSTDAQISFGANGSSYTVTNGKTYTSTIDKLNAANSKPTGLAVGATYLFVSHGGLNQLHVINKSTGALAQNLAITTPRSLSVEGSSLWMVSGTNTVAKYTINANGTLSAATLTLAGITTPGAIATNGGNIAVIDAGSNQIVRFYNTTSGVQGTQLGTTGGYSVSPDVTNTKFMFGNFRLDGFSYIAYAPDGSFWVGDGGNYRNQHFSASKTFIETIMSMGADYSTNVDPNNINRVFGNYLEFAINYAQPITGSTGWTLAKNWGFVGASTNSSLTKMANIVTLSNGRTYGFVVGVGYCELTATGPRNTGLNPSGIICQDGSRQVTTGSFAVGGVLTVTKYPLTGFDGSNNPVWSGSGTVIATTPSNTLQLPATNPQTEALTSTNKVVFYQTETYLLGVVANMLTGHHLGAIKKGGNTYLWKTQKADHRNYQGSFPKEDYFEIGNGVNDFSGSRLTIVDNNLFSGYHGEFWKAGQTNYYNHYLDDGMPVGQFGTDFYAITHNQNIYPQPPVGFAGNALTPQAVKDGSGNIYLYHGDESYHAGIHRWKISNLSSIAEQTIVIPFPSTYVAPAINYVDLHAGLPFDQTLTSSAGWTKTGTVAYYTNRKKYANDGLPDVFSQFVPPYTITSGTASTQRDLGTNNVTSNWAITTNISYEATNTLNTNAKMYVEVLDAAGKILARLYYTVSGSTITLKGNTATIVSDAAVVDTLFALKPLVIKCANGIVTFTYANYAPVSSAIFDASGNWKTPKTLRTFVTYAPASSDIATDLQGSRLYLDIAATGAIYYISTSGDDTRTAAQAQNPATPWKTLAKVTSSQATFNAGDSILFKRGETFYGALTLTKSGVANNLINYGAYGTGAKPIITGLTTVSAWANLGGGIYETTTAISTLATCNLVLRNSIVQQIGRYPNANTANKGYLTFQSHIGQTSITSNAISAAPNFVGGELVIRPIQHIIDRNLITAQSSTTVTYTPTSSYVPIDGYGFFFQDHPNTLDQLGEWYYNKVTKKLRMYWGGTAPGPVDIATVDVVIDASSRSYLSFTNLDIRGANTVGLYMSSGSNMKVNNCDVSYSGQQGIEATNALNTSVTNSTVNWALDNGIRFIQSANNVTSNNIVQDCSVTNIQMIAGMGESGDVKGMGIAMYGSNSTVERNTVRNIGYCPIYYVWGNNMTIKNNILDSFVRTKNDGGGIYTWNNGTSPLTYTGQRITGNIITNAVGAPEGTISPSTAGYGIMMDINSNGIEVDNNTCNKLERGWFDLGGWNINFHNNTFYDNTTDAIDIYYGSASWPHSITNLNVKNNILVAKSTTQLVVKLRTILANYSTMGAFDSNYYARPIDDNLTIYNGVFYGVSGSTVTQRNLAAWQVYSGYDLNTKKSPVTVTDTSKIKFYYNPTASPIVKTLVGNYIDVKSVGYSGNITLQPYTSIVLLPAPITKTTPTITWINSLSKIYPAPITSGDLNATGSVAGVITYNTSAGTIYNPGTYTLTATLTPTDTASYNIAIKNITLTVTLSSGQKVCINSNGSNGIYLFNHQNYNGSPLNLYAGDTLCINSGTYDFVSIFGLVGSAAKPIVVINNGLVVSGTSTYCFKFTNCQFVKFTGTGSGGASANGTTYGFKGTWASGKAGACTNIGDSCSDFEVEHIWAEHVENGFIMKINPSANEPWTWRGHWVQANYKIHDNYTHNSNGEGLYGVNTDIYDDLDSSGTTIRVLPVPGTNWDVYNNIFDSTGWDAIQIASCTGCRIHDNIATNYGTRDISSQQAGIILGGRSNGSIYNNRIYFGTGNGIEYYGWGKDSSGIVNVGNRVDIYNNIIDSAGWSVAQKQDGVYFDSRPSQSDSLKAYVLNNTITNSGRYGVNTFNSNGDQAANSKINNNLIVHPGSSYINKPVPLIVDTTFNQRISTIAAANFTNYAAKNFLITGASPAFDAGKNLSVYLTTDIIGTNRPQNVAYDDGAYEFIPSGVKITPVISWSIPNKVYNTLIVASDLQPTSGGVAGTYTFTGIALGQKFPVGTYTVSTQFTPSDQATYNNATGTATFSVTPQPLTGAFSNTSKVFNNTPQQPTFTTSPVAGVAYSITFDGVGLIPTNVKVVGGVVTPYNTQAGVTDVNYTMPVVNGTFTITPAPGTFTVSNLSYIYDSTLKNITVTTSNPAITYTVTGGNKRYSGSYSITVHNTNTNFNVPDVVTTMTINKGTTSLVSWTPANMTYNAAIGAAQTNATFAKNGVSTYTPTTGFVPNAGTLPMRLDFVPSDTNLLPINNIIRNITVSKGTDVMSLTSDTTQYFDGNPKTVTVTTLHGGTVTVTYTGAHTAVGDYPFTATYFDANWQAVSVSGTLHILANNATIRITNFANRIFTGSPIDVTVTSAYTYTLVYTPSNHTNVNNSIQVIATINDGIHTGADTVIMSIIKATPSTSWPAISGGAFPYVVGSGILNASTPVAGTWSYNVNVGDTLSVGTNIISATFTPTDAADYNSVTITNTVVVTTGTAIINVINPAFQYDGTQKSIIASTTPPNLDSLLIAYVGGRVNTGSYPFTVQLNNANYVAQNVSGTLIISQGSYQLSWATPAPIPTGSPLTALELNPSSTIPGTFTFNYPLGTILPTGTIALVGTFHPTDSFNYPVQTIMTTISVYGSPFLDYFIRHGNTIYLNLLP